MRECLGTIGLNLKTLHQMKQLDRLVNEVRGRADAGLNSAPTLIMRTSIKGTCSHLENKSTKRRLFSILMPENRYCGEKFAPSVKIFQKEILVEDAFTFLAHVLMSFFPFFLQFSHSRSSGSTPLLLCSLE